MSELRNDIYVIEYLVRDDLWRVLMGRPNEPLSFVSREDALGYAKHTLRAITRVVAFRRVET